MSEQHLKALTATLSDIGDRVQAMKKNTEDKQSELQARLQELEQKAVGNGFPSASNDTRKNNSRNDHSSIVAQTHHLLPPTTTRAGNPTRRRTNFTIILILISIPTVNEFNG